MTKPITVSLTLLTLLLRVLRLHLAMMERRGCSELLLHAFLFDSNAHFSKGQVIYTKQEVDDVIQGSTGFKSGGKDRCQERGRAGGHLFEFILWIWILGDGVGGVECILVVG